MRQSILLLVLACFANAQTLHQRVLPLGDLYRQSFSSAPFPHPDRSNGRLYGGKTFSAAEHYSDSSVAIFVPKQFRQGKVTDLVIYFHGWYNNIDSACVQFSLLDQFAAAGKNAVFIFPEGPKDSPDSFGGRLESDSGLQRLVEDVLLYLKKEGRIRTTVPGRIVLAGHSGAYRVISYILLRGGLTKNIADVILFDALYGQTEKFAYWLDHSKGRFVNIYTDSGGTRQESENLMADLDAWKMKYFAATETLTTEKDLRTNRILFLHSDLEHNDVIGKRSQFLKFLRTGPLQ